MLESRDPDCPLHGQSLGRPWDTPDIYDGFRDVLVVATEGNQKFRQEIHPPPAFFPCTISISSFDSCSAFVVIENPGSPEWIWPGLEHWQKFVFIGIPVSAIVRFY